MRRPQEIKRQRGLVIEKDRLIQLFVTDLEKLVTEIDPSYWRDAIRQLYRTYVKKGSKEAGARDVPDSMDEFARQREYMERSLETLKRRATKVPLSPIPLPPALPARGIIVDRVHTAR